MTTALRDKNVAALGDGPLDVLIVGGGINGAVSAAALASRGARVGLIDARDFAGLTSQHSSNLVWGGIKYMEGYEFGLVAELCRARNLLLDSFPSTVKEIRFFMTLNRLLERRGGRRDSRSSARRAARSLGGTVVR